MEASASCFLFRFVCFFVFLTYEAAADVFFSTGDPEVLGDSRCEEFGQHNTSRGKYRAATCNTALPRKIDGGRVQEVSRHRPVCMKRTKAV